MDKELQEAAAQYKALMAWAVFKNTWGKVAKAYQVQREMAYWTNEFHTIRSKYVKRGRKAAPKAA